MTDDICSFGMLHGEKQIKRPILNSPSYIKNEFSPIRDTSFCKLVLKYIWSAEDFIKNNKFYSGINHTAFLIPQILYQIPLFCLSSKYKTSHCESPSPSSILCSHPSFWTEITKVNKVNQASLTLAWFFYISRSTVTDLIEFLSLLCWYLA